MEQYKEENDYFDQLTGDRKNLVLGGKVGMALVGTVGTMSQAFTGYVDYLRHEEVRDNITEGLQVAGVSLLGVAAITLVDVTIDRFNDKTSSGQQG